MMFVLTCATPAFAKDSKAEKSASESVSTNLEVIETVINKKSINLEAKTVTANKVVLKWKNNDSFICYDIYKFNDSEEKWEKVAKTTDNTVEIGSLEADTVQQFSILNSATGELLGALQVKTAVKKPSIKVKLRTSKKVVLFLGKHSENETVVIYRKESGKDYKKLAEVSSKSTYTDKDVKQNTTYYYKAKVISTKNSEKSESQFSKAVKAKTLLSMGLPSVSGKTKTYAFYTAVTAKSSPQYKLLNSEECTTDEETGIRMYDGCYCVALGSYYGTKIGTKYRITFSSGNSINVVLCDQKANRHTDSKHQYAVNNKDIVEFYVQKSKMPSKIRNRGNYGILSQFSGSVVSIEKYTD